MLVLFGGVDSLSAKEFVHVVFHLGSLCYNFITKSGFVLNRFYHAEEVSLHLFGSTIRGEEEDRKAHCLQVLILGLLARHLVILLDFIDT